MEQDDKAEKNQKKKANEGEYVDRNDLTFRMIATYRTVSKQDYTLMNEIENKKVDLAFIKGIAADESSFEEEERMHDNIRKFQKKVPINESLSEDKRSDNSELKVSVRSSQNYFMDFEK